MVCVAQTVLVDERDVRKAFNALALLKVSTLAEVAGVAIPSRATRQHDGQDPSPTRAVPGSKLRGGGLGSAAPPTAQARPG
eukprot:CAMPEP_0170306526 /NCGR_PEP_ID=MMETSP0116_2-20130129/53655_1 /TAXON_ID=400756 /ORGANISM="Durinskia baltica, Strain CSIRO CS-38" /LENGTH=80 /DNA_ID=CAMNT_0010558613 /DNA_START=119 /DNA_END=356 /DNA_ORIENTATION=+